MYSSHSFSIAKTLGTIKVLPEDNENSCGARHGVLFVELVVESICRMFLKDLVFIFPLEINALNSIFLS